ncbi:Rha family transcriptional regulator [Chromobacterium haemolyticum]|uniref:Rha family transcriptional regulator n=1 Tax=Chromobacterium fluminis TaxID=3044269 RepID=A0ABX0LDD1_9NEIS|nr:Rha family transcriptional regulator [Chromobacterium haemolyticum]NHR07626.1 Rha family transcriptional regulator [Chromobacterium haemolyticum]
MPASLNLTPQDLILVHDNELRTTSLKVADAFGKLHKDVLRRIESLDCSKEFASAHFCANTRTEKIGDRGAKREFKYYEMTKDGFMFLVMGFTGAQAARIKEAYINAFNWMAKQLFGPGAGSGLKNGDVTVSARGLESLRLTLNDFRASALRVSETMISQMPWPRRGEVLSLWTYAHELPLSWLQLGHDKSSGVSAVLLSSGKAPALKPLDRWPRSPTTTARWLMATAGRSVGKPVGSPGPVIGVRSEYMVVREKVLAWLSGIQQPITARDVAMHALGLSPEQVSAGDLIRVGRVLRSARWHHSHIDVDGKYVRVYHPPRRFE